MILLLFDNRLKGQVHSDGCSVRISTFSDLKHFKNQSLFLPPLNTHYSQSSPLIYTVKTRLKRCRVFWSLSV